ncbi:uncharacterized protein LOC129803478 isoform X2 [Phlebotomus papatasi]|uniref:uncharacterized protein LOC129803478 isoform X2 n=1 Tax=Phlebotomus papatasi TaxID=29031 RepID=UPI002483AE2C|nr:uncharacterized protein LOC129803478 isoform X2 [Phlebotomus papatasi]XP_055706045.1 uncharacterized protein LOC129803478 isoform X2 [Phlebotomus papatasi]
MFSAEDLMIPLASMFDYGDTTTEQRSTSSRRSTNVQKDYTWVRVDDTAVPDFTVQWEKGLGKKEKDFYRSKYPQVDYVTNDRVHCTSCDTHLGSAPIDEVTIREHPVLKVTQCSKCYAFYTSGEFDKGEDGSELYCRWCGQGGEVFCCAKCPYVFCKKCIIRNLSKDTIKAIIKNENWMCFACEPEITWPLRAKHWALMNFIEKQRKVILTQYVSDSDVNFLLSRDLTTCCQKAAPAPKDTGKKSLTPGKAATAAKASPKPSPVLSAQKTLPVPKTVQKTRKRSDVPDYSKGPPAKRMMTEVPMNNSAGEGRSQDEVVCTPDILSMFDGSAAEPTPPPLTQIRQYGTSPSTNGTPTTSRAAAQKKTQTITIANQSPATPIYHTINGYRIDLNSAARQETIRLPNGKLIQVKKQSTPQAQQPPMVPPLMTPAVRGMRPSGAPVRQPPVPRMPNPPRQRRQQQPVLRPQVPPAATQQRPVILNGMMQPQMCNMPPLIISQQMANTPFGKAKTELDGRIRNGQEICMHIIGKMNTLVASNAYKSMKSVKDVKEIHIHLSYLLTYAINRFKTLQEKSMDNMKILGFGGDVESIMSGKITTNTNDEEVDENDDDIEIVEPQTTLIDLASDEEEAVKDVVADTPIAKESQMFLDKLKMQPKILLKKLPGSAIMDSKTHEKENEMIVKDFLKDILDKVLESMTAESAETVDGVMSEENNQKEDSGRDSVSKAADVAKEIVEIEEPMDVDAIPDAPTTTISLDDDDSNDVVEVIEKVQKETVEKPTEDVTGPAEVTEKPSDEDAKVVDVDMENDGNKEDKEDKEEKEKEVDGNQEKVNEEKSLEVKDAEMQDEDTDMTEIVTETIEKDKKNESVEDEKMEENPVEEIKDKAEEGKIEENGAQNEIEDEDMEKDHGEEKQEEPKGIAEAEADAEPQKDDQEGENEGFKMPQATVDSEPPAQEAVEQVAEPREKEAQEEEPKEEAPKPVLESPASPDPADFNPTEIRAFEDIDSPDEFDDALDAPASQDSLLDDLVKPSDVPFPDDLDSLGKFLDN